MHLRPRHLPLVRSCSIAAATGMAAILAGSVLTALPAAAAVAGSASQNPSGAVASGVLIGTVRGPGGAGLARVCVVATGPVGAKAAVSGSDGRYVITDMRPGSYAINFRDCGAAGQYLSQWYGDSVLPDDAARVQVSAGMPATLKPVTMEPLGGMRTLNRAAPAGQLHAWGRRPADLRSAEWCEARLARAWQEYASRPSRRLPTA